MPVAVRLPRTAAARRALLVVLFLGGLLALAFLFGGSAHAAERGELGGAADQRASASGVLDSEHARKQAQKHNVPAKTAKAADTAGHAAQKAVRPVQEPVEQQARKITEPVGDLVRHTAGDRLPVRLPDVGLGKAGGAGHDGFAPSHGLTEAPTVPAGLPSVPADLPTVPAQLPTVPADLPTVPADLPTVPVGLPTVPAQLPTVPADLPTVPVGLPTVPAQLPTVPADLPTVPAGLPTVPAQLPTVPAGLPTVPVGLPTAPGALPAV
ncbi:hypothetical protein [Streptomyces sp. NPDC005336]|uniref:hypothetical protein n=1 Tax=Streptomyces sp. NPDC005336 TaxID=3157035 RepID=UPI0033B6B2A2